ncbi:MAG TPA: outer membrane lipoprotein carrier protein LolA [Treponemataceae bacterium]|nr:outer membrane lipoprotein carrier protein LolA [Treponemataceae bacterium]
MNTPKFRKVLFSLSLIVFYSAFAVSQTITTADAFFSSMSDTYASLSDYSANIKIKSGTGQKTSIMAGRFMFKKPNLLRIDFTNPDEQTIVFNGDLLTIYLPLYDVVLNQTVEKGSSSSGASLATPQGLSLMKRYYSISYETGPDPVGLEENSKEQVIVLSLSRRSTTEMFRTIRLMINPETRLIRRIDARTLSGDQVQFDFTGYALNQGILDNRFVYDSPSSANMFNDFLFNE